MNSLHHGDLTMTSIVVQDVDQRFQGKTLIGNTPLETLRGSV